MKAGESKYELLDRAFPQLEPWVDDEPISVQVPAPEPTPGAEVTFGTQGIKVTATGRFADAYRWMSKKIRSSQLSQDDWGQTWHR